MERAVTNTLPEFQPIMVWEARARVHPYIYRTPLLYSHALSQRTGAEVYLKMECWQVCGCFKVRGVSNFLSAITPEQFSRGLVTASSGNHGLGLAYIARLLGISPVKIFLPETGEPAKINKLKLLGAEPIIGGKDFFAAYDRAQSFLEETGLLYVHSHAHPLIIAGQGTIGLEILEDIPGVDMIVVPIGGGGLVSGIAAAVKSIAPSVRIVGVEPMAAPGAYLSLREGRFCERIELRPSIADGLMGGFSPLPFQIAHTLIERVELVEETEILEAMRSFFKEDQLFVEGSAAVGLAAMLAGKIRELNKKVVLVLTGRNINAEKFLSLMRKERG